MTSPTTLSLINHILFQEGLDCVIEKASETNPHDYILVYLGLDNHKRERSIKITSEEQLLSENVPEETAKTINEGYVRIQFQSALPFLPVDIAIPDIASTLLFINRTLDLPGFELSEFDNRITYRYVLLATTNSITKPLLLSIIGMIMLYTDMYAETIEKVGTGKITFNGLMEEVIDVSKKIP